MRTELAEVQPEPVLDAEVQPEPVLDAEVQTEPVPEAEVQTEPVPEAEVQPRRRRSVVGIPIMEEAKRIKSMSELLGIESKIPTKKSRGRKKSNI